MKRGFVVLLISGCAGFLTGGCGSSQPAPQTTTTAANLRPTLTLPNQDVASAVTTTAATTTTAPPPPNHTHAGHTSHARAGGAKPPSSASSGSSGTGYSGAQSGHGGTQSGYSGTQSGYSGTGTHSGYSGTGTQSAYSGAQSGYSGTQSGPSSSASSAGTSASGGTTTVVHTVTVVHRVIIHVTKTKTKTKTKIKTRTETKTRTKIKTVVQVKTVQAPPPAVPQGAFPPAGQSPTRLSAFRTVDGAIGCSLAGGTAWCDIGSRTWTPPAKPSSCNVAWGQGLSVGPSGAARFVCAGDTALDPSGPVVRNGQDDAVGSVTCQVRNVGVACFDRAGEGFFIARTGYTVF
jgi:hypothetical protein